MSIPYRYFSPDFNGLIKQKGVICVNLPRKRIITCCKNHKVWQSCFHDLARNVLDCIGSIFSVILTVHEHFVALCSFVALARTQAVEEVWDERRREAFNFAKSNKDVEVKCWCRVFWVTLP